MKSVLDQLVRVERNKAYQILNRVVDSKIVVQIKAENENKILNTTLKKINLRKHFYITARVSTLESKPIVAIKIIIQNKLFFLKTKIKNVDANYYFEDYENFFELVRRRSPRFQLPAHWLQSAVIQSTESIGRLKSPATIVELSKSGMKLNIGPEIPRYEKNQNIKLKFKILQHAEVQIYAKIVYTKKNMSAGPTIGVQLLLDSILLKNKIQNLYEDLAFFYAAEAII